MPGTGVLRKEKNVSLNTAIYVRLLAVVSMIETYLMYAGENEQDHNKLSN